MAQGRTVGDVRVRHVVEGRQPEDRHAVEEDAEQRHGSDDHPARLGEHVHVEPQHEVKVAEDFLES